jgi:hypothetical protein
MSFFKRLKEFNKRNAAFDALVPDKYDLIGNFAENEADEEANKQRERMLRARADEMNRGMRVPTGMNKSMFQVMVDGSRLDPGSVIRRNTLKAHNPKLNQAFVNRDIFAYNAAMANLRTMISRTSGGPKLAAEMPDQMEQRRLARIKQGRLPVGSRERTMMGAF